MRGTKPVLPQLARLDARCSWPALAAAAADHSPKTGKELPDLSWVPPEDGFDWIQLKSGEWLKGEFKGMQERQLDFDSSELDYPDFRMGKDPPGAHGRRSGNSPGGRRDPQRPRPDHAHRSAHPGCHRSPVAARPAAEPDAGRQERALLLVRGYFRRPHPARRQLSTKWISTATCTCSGAPPVPG